MKNSVFKTEEGRDKFRAYYNQVLSQFPFTQQSVETAFGQTFILTAGRESNPPIILLHGSCSNSAFWFPEIMALSNDYRVYAVDIIGEAGNSEEYRPDIDSDAFALWMKDVLNALSIERTVLIASAGLAQVRPQFILNVEQTRQTDGTVPVTSDIIGEQNFPKEVLEFMNLIVESYNPIQELPVFLDEQLLRLNMPVLFIDGEDDVIIDARGSSRDFPV